MQAGDDVVFNQARPIPSQAEKRTLVHPFSAFVLVLIDSLWFLAEWNVLAWIFTVPLSFLSVCISTILIERHLNGHEKGKALAIGFFLGLVAAVPFPVVSSSVGASLLAWTGLKRVLNAKRH